MARTSNTDPLHVDWLPVSTSGHIGITLAPGKHGFSTSGAPWHRDLATDLAHLVAHHEARTLACLLEEHEFARLKIPAYLTEARKRSIEVLRLPIPDGGTPAAMSSLLELVAHIRERAARGVNVVIHCAAGLGRSGIVGGSVLIADGMTAQEAIATLHRVRSAHSPENTAQEEYLAAVERHLRAIRPSAKELAGVPPLPSRVVGAVLGAAVGDAMGHPTEFAKLDAIRAKWGPTGVQGFELFWKRDGARFAPYTDDTQMAEAVLRTLLDGAARGADLDRTMQAMATAFIGWNEQPQGGHRAPGGACQRGCETLASGVHWSKAGGEADGGCGSVMRAYPFGLVFHDDLERAEEWAVQHSKLTHRDPIALAACAAMAVGTSLAVARATPDEVVATMIAAARRHDPKTADMMQRALDEARDGVPPDVTLLRLQAWAAHEAIAAAIYIFTRHPNDPRAAILEGANTDGDSDSIATLAGALVGGRCGVEAIPKEWVAQVERSAELVKLGRAVPIAPV